MENATKATRPPLEKVLEIDAPTDAVWEAISTAEGISRWFTFKTRVTPGIGGEMYGEWSPGDGGTMRFESWEPGRHLRLVEDSMVPGLPQWVDYTIEPSKGGGGVVLRLVHSGIGADAKWAEMYDSVNRGWDVFMNTLKHSVERHPGLDRVVGYAACQPAVSRADAWDLLAGPDGLSIRRDGDAFSIGDPSAGGVEGRTWVWNPPKDLAGTVSSMDDAALWIAIEQFGERPNLSITLSAFGVPEALVRATESAWQATLDRVFPSGD